MDEKGRSGPIGQSQKVLSLKKIETTIRRKETEQRHNVRATWSNRDIME